VREPRNRMGLITQMTREASGGSAYSLRGQNFESQVELEIRGVEGFLLGRCPVTTNAIVKA